MRASAPSLRRPILMRILIGLGFLGALAAAFAAGVLVTIKRDGKETHIEVPEESTTRIDANGHVEVALPGQQPSRPSKPVIEDMDVVRVTALEEFEPMTWRWKVHLPKGQRYHWDVAYGDLPASGVPRPRWSAYSNEPYWETGLDAILTAALRRQDDGNWSLTVTCRSLNTKWTVGSGSVSIPDSALRPMLNAGRIEEGILGSRATETLSSAKPIILLKRRVFVYEELSGDVRRQSTKATPGYMFWLQPQGINDVPETLEQELIPSQPKPAARPPAVSPAAEVKALQGRWKVVRVEKGDNADASLARTFGLDGSHARPAKLGLGNLGFKNGTLDVFDYTKINDWHYSYVIDPSAATKTIDLTGRRQSTSRQKDQEVLGIYEIDGDRLRLCLARRMPEVKTEHRPSKFAIVPGSGDILVVLDRYHPSDDETAMQGWWNVTSWIEDGNSASAESVQTLAGYWEGDQFRIDSQVREAWLNPGKDGRSVLDLPVRMGWGGGGSDERKALRGQGFLDPTKQPKTITIAATDFDDNFTLKTKEVFGIYKFENDRLIIAYRLGAGRPETFESTPGSGVTLLVLERPKAGTIGAQAPGTQVVETSPVSRSTNSAGQSTAATPFPFRTTTVTRGDIVETVEATGTIEPEEVVDIGAEVTGTVVRLGDDPRGNSDPNYKDKTIDYGSPVEKNMILARIDDTLYKVRVDQQKAGCARAEADLAVARANAKGETSEAAKAAVVAAEAAVAQAKAALLEAQINLACTTVKSPTKGVIVDRRVNAGQNVGPSPNSPGLFLIARDLGKVQIWASVNEADIGRIRQGMEATFTVNAFPKDVFTGTVTQIRLNATLTQNVVTYTVVVKIEKPDRKLLPYMTANLLFQIAKKENVLRVDNAALRWKPTPDQVAPDVHSSPLDAKNRFSSRRLWVMADARHVRLVDAQIGLHNAAITEVSGPDVKEGMEVVIGQTLGPAPNVPQPFIPSKAAESKPYLPPQVPPAATGPSAGKTPDAAKTQSTP